jgi:hypothetical protein
MSIRRHYRENIESVFKLLESHDDGLTTSEIALKLALNPGSVYAVVSTQPGVYVDRWTASMGGWSPVYCLGEERDAPKPEISVRSYLRRQEKREVA